MFALLSLLFKLRTRENVNTTVNPCWDLALVAALPHRPAESSVPMFSNLTMCKCLILICRKMLMCEGNPPLNSVCTNADLSDQHVRIWKFVFEQLSSFSFFATALQLLCL